MSAFFGLSGNKETFFYHLISSPVCIGMTIMPWCAYNNGRKTHSYEMGSGIKRKNITKRLENSFKNLCLQWGIHNSSLSLNFAVCIHQVSSPCCQHLFNATQFNSQCMGYEIVQQENFFTTYLLAFLTKCCEWDGSILFLGMMRLSSMFTMEMKTRHSFCYRRV